MVAVVASILIVVASGMAPAPQRVKYTSRKGDVTFDHAAHMARREGCKSCHGAGPARKIAFDTKKAHVFCVGCHLNRKVGPKACTKCHDDG